MKTFYQLSARGPLQNFLGSSGTIFSKTIFSSKEKAEAHKKEFIKNCTDDSNEAAFMTQLSLVNKISIVELELNEEE